MQCKCHHVICNDCFTEYYNACISDFNIYPLKCPVDNCGRDIYKALSQILDEDSYERFKVLRKRKKLLTDPNVKWCTVINCDGYGKAKNNEKVDCNICQTEINSTKDPDTLEISKKYSVIECPGCRCLIEKTFGCMRCKCYCGTEFCMKCERILSRYHNN